MCMCAVYVRPLHGKGDNLVKKISLRVLSTARLPTDSDRSWQTIGRHQFYKKFRGTMLAWKKHFRHCCGNEGSASVKGYTVATYKVAAACFV